MNNFNRQPSLFEEALDNTRLNKPINTPYNLSGAKKQVTVEERTGMSNQAWGMVLTIVEFSTDIIKGVLVVGGILAANLADFIMGTIGVSFLMSNDMMSQYKLSGFLFGSIISMGSSAVQIFMWSLIQKRGIRFSHLIHWKRLPKDVQAFLGAALFLWGIDTFLDMSPLTLLFSNKMYVGFPLLYKFLVGAVSLVVLILCGFAEVLTSNLRLMLEGEKTTQPKVNAPSPKQQSKNLRDVFSNVK